MFEQDNDLQILEIEEVDITEKPLSTAQQALMILESIPKEQWCTGVLSNHDGTHCALGHTYNHNYGYYPKDYVENMYDPYTQKINELTIKYHNDKYDLNISLSDVNDGDYAISTLEPIPYPETHPKDRVIHCLKDMVEAGY